MVQVSVHEAKSQLSRLIDAALAGEPVTITRSGVPVVDMVRHAMGQGVVEIEPWKGFEVDPAVFDGTDDEVTVLFYGESS
ncbi:MAG: type II toxin-antitoxin system prevent-host-death family antitoxin [Actinomycetales bacterium]|nr:type II toxin-antitoxin system prevent-host-death family antitoxin [Actinomycetales bacterium]